MRSLPLPLTLTARLLPVAVLAIAGWALSADPFTAAPTADHRATQDKPTGSDSAPSTAPSTRKTYDASPAPCAGIPVASVKALVPGAKTAGQEIASTDKSLRRTCSWNALKGFDYRWLDVSYEIKDSDAAAAKAYKDRVDDKSGGGAVPGLGDSAYSVVNLTTDDKQQTREGVVIAQVSNALVVVTYNGSDFETKKAPGTDVINKGAIKAAKDAVNTLKGGLKV